MSAKKKASKKKVKLNTDNILKIIIVFCVALIIVFLVDPIKKRVTKENVDDAVVSPTIEDETVYVQDLLCDVDYVSKFKILFSTYGYVYETGSLHLKIESDEYGVIYDEDIPLDKIVDNEYYVAEFDSISDSQGKIFTFTFYYTDYSEDYNISYWYYQGKDEDYTLKINEEETDQVMKIISVGEGNSYVFVWYISIFTILCVMLLTVGGKYEK